MKYFNVLEAKSGGEKNRSLSIEDHGESHRNESSSGGLP